ncbi:MAG: hypothetical protein A3D95_14965 [Betaproteobacteria bacterium RIFCSPHIGHO2_12_FULL_69_13]|nr:MAG: hypothetical protein A3D95_14965 [Betaproteobacteria bacterium RIFCSPHIGHO2_12_FULL_69_13]OGA66081.1 MAG: hypothetical protein A3G83_10155 [Betaproteobacteria bacterium RIFCSPLOWO2_12_FULL_68_20]
MRWQDWASFWLGLWLAVSPWLLGHSGEQTATANAVLAGLLIAVASALDLGFDAIQEERFVLAAGLWLIVAPFALGFATLWLAAANSIVVGLAAVFLAGWALALDKDIGKWWRDRATGH